MPEHAIHLRRAWKVVGGGRVDLPTNWPAGTGCVTLTRRFNRPPIDPAGERLWIRMRSVPGLTAARLNGRDLDPPGGDDRWAIPVELPPASELELDVAPPSDGATWGEIALLIEPRGPG